MRLDAERRPFMDCTFRFLCLSCISAGLIGPPRRGIPVYGCPSRGLWEDVEIPEKLDTQGDRPARCLGSSPATAMICHYPTVSLGGRCVSGFVDCFGLGYQSSPPTSNIIMLHHAWVQDKATSASVPMTMSDAFASMSRRPYLSVRTCMEHSNKSLT
ncbi:hypothetical protein IQ07DRAFT_13108 [Pyrenochaeta sp. DS3sAY3a]|nr:hypothetical protein IQ07DRAFT_13108 [Pyrenochaeta sp. DS3sAY3a]